MRNVNKAIVMAYYAVILKLNNFPHGGSITAFSVATTEHWKDKNPRQTQTGYRMAQNCRQQLFSRDCQKYLKKGGKVYIEGTLRTRKWKDDSIFRKGNNQDKSRCAAIVLSE